MFTTLRSTIRSRNSRSCDENQQQSPGIIDQPTLKPKKWHPGPDDWSAHRAAADPEQHIKAWATFKRTRQPPEKRPHRPTFHRALVQSQAMRRKPPGAICARIGQPPTAAQRSMQFPRSAQPPSSRAFCRGDVALQRPQLHIPVQDELDRGLVGRRQLLGHVGNGQSRWHLEAAGIRSCSSPAHQTQETSICRCHNSHR